MKSHRGSVEMDTKALKGAILVGGCGYVGRHVAMAINRLGYQVLLLDVMGPSLTFLNKIASLSIPIIYQSIDIATESQRLAEIFASFAPEIVISVAGWGMSGESMLSPRCHDINVQGTQNILTACKSNGVKHFIYTSTYNVVFGGHEILNGNEDLPYFPVDQHPDEYSKSKAIAEELVLQNNGQNTGADGQFFTAVIRPAAIYGETEQRHLPRIVKHIDQGMFLFTIGKALVDWVYIDNLVQAYVLLVQKIVKVKTPQNHPAGQAYFISDGTPIENFEFFRPLVLVRKRSYPSVQISTYTAYCLSWLLEDIYWLTKSLGFPLTPLMTRAEVYKVGVSHYFSIDKAKKQLGYRPTISSTEGGQRLARHYEKFYHSLNYFEFAPLVFYILIFIGMFLTYQVAFHDEDVGYGESFLASFLYQPVDYLALWIFRSRMIVRCVFFAALAAHVGEMIVAYDVAMRFCPNMKFAWAVQTFLLGYPSLSLLLARHNLDTKKEE